MSTDAKYVAKSKADLSNIASHDPAIIMTESEPKSIVKSPQNPNQDGPVNLEHAYVFWVMIKSTQPPPTGQSNNYENEIKAISKFKTAQEFWSIYQFLKKPSAMTPGSTLNLFVDGIKPMWEDEANKFGGRWTLRLNKGFSNKIWEDLILGMIGEQFEIENEIHGVIITVRSNFDTISVWIKNGKDQAKVQKVKQDIIRICSLSDDIKIEFECFFKDPADQQHQHIEHKPKTYDKRPGGPREIGAQQRSYQSQQQQEPQKQYKAKQGGGPPHKDSRAK